MTSDVNFDRTIRRSEKRLKQRLAAMLATNAFGIATLTVALLQLLN
jgi:hypothetical protein